MNANDPNTPTYELSLWQKRQATMIYHFTSLDYLKALLPQIDALIAMAEEMLEQRTILDPLMTDERWGVRNTAANWSMGAFPALIAFREGILWHIGKRQDHCYGITGNDQCARMLGEFSMQWATKEQEQAFRDRVDEVYMYASRINGMTQRTWNDRTFWLVWEQIKHLFKRLPKFKVHTAIEGETGKVPPRTGVYVPQDDPNGTLQFGWTGGGTGRFAPMKVCQTFNDIGLDALKAVGRGGLWGDTAGLTKFIEHNLHRCEFFPSDTAIVDYRVANESFTERPCKWYFVELLEGEFENSDPDYMGEGPARPKRQEAGEACAHAGWWYTVASNDAPRYFEQGQIFPACDTGYGITLWQWCQNQPPAPTPPKRKPWSF